MKWASLEEKAKIEHVEVCPSALKLTAEIARRVGEDGGGALVVDYGEDVMVSDSLQVSATILWFPYLNFLLLFLETFQAS